MFSISEQPIKAEELRRRLDNPHSGAFVSFEGLVRNHNEGRKVKALEYEAFIEMAMSQGEKIIEEACQQFELDQVLAVHRVGQLEIEDLAVWIGVCSVHRDAAFKACRYIIDQIKTRLPIWKREHYLDGDAHWVNCQHCYHAVGHGPKGLEKEMYRRQTPLAELGNEGQSRLKTSRLAVVGAGALGCAALPYLAAAGVGEITIFDGDRLEVSNLHRQTLYTLADRGQYKAKLAEKRLAEQNPYIKVEGRLERIQAANIAQNLKAYDAIIDCSDNFETKYLLHDFAFLEKITLIQASIYKFEVQVHVFRHQGQGCLRCLWPQEPSASCIGSCAEVGVLGSTAGVAGALQAQEAIKALLGLSSLKDDEMLIMDLMELRQEKIKKPRDKNCPLCGETPSIRSLEERPVLQPRLGEYELDLNLLRGAGKDFEIIDIRESAERNPHCPFEHSLVHIPCQHIEKFMSLSAKKNYLLVCQSGARSRRTVQRLQELGYRHFYALTVGMESLESEKR